MKFIKFYCIAFLAVSIFTGCAKYRIKKKRNDNNQELVADQKLKNNDLGKELKEGNSIIYRGLDGIFWVKATPYSVKINENVSFSGNCGQNNAGQLNWNLGDGEKSEETTFAHSYKTAGTFKVKVSCAESGKDGQTGTLTITVKNANPLDPNQNPNQNPNQSGTSPSQNK